MRCQIHINQRRESASQLTALQAVDTPPPLLIPCLYTNINNDGIKVTSLVCAVETEDDSFRYTDMTCVRYRCRYRSIFYDTDTELTPAVSADTKYQIPVSVSPYNIL